MGPIFIFFVVGFWHGANWTFIIWGTLHGLFIVIERLLNPVSTYLKSKLGGIVTNIIGFILFFNAFTIANIFFRSASVPDALVLFKQIFTLPGTNLNPGLQQIDFKAYHTLLLIKQCH